MASGDKDGSVPTLQGGPQAIHSPPQGEQVHVSADEASSQEVLLQSEWHCERVQTCR